MALLTHLVPVDWMHPSWRDLVIERLIFNRPVRRAFLQRCGLAGFLLALSSAGGATGERELPLLRTEEDWLALGEAVPRVLQTHYFAAWQVLSTLRTALFASTETRPAAGATGKLVTNLAEVVLATLRSSWSAGENHPNAWALELYYQVSELIVPLPSGPDLRALWEVTWLEACTTINELDPADLECNLENVLEWTRVLVTIEKNEPRFLRQLCFPHFHGESLKLIVSKLSRRVEAQFDLDDETVCTEEESRMEAIRTITAAIAGFCGDATKEAQALAKQAKAQGLRAESLRREIEEKLNEEEREEREKYRGYSLHSKAALPEHDPLKAELNIEELFRDL